MRLLNNLFGDLQMSLPFFAIIELRGHIIDSLTLAKVIDKIQSLDCQYQINDIQIGQQKTDLSYAQISIWAKNKELLDTALDEIKPYGALPISDSTMHLEPCSDNRVVPKDAYVRLNPPMEVFCSGRWIKVDRDGYDLVIVVDSAKETASLRKISEVIKGDMVVTGKGGIKILPTLVENGHTELIKG